MTDSIQGVLIGGILGFGTSTLSAIIAVRMEVSKQKKSKLETIATKIFKSNLPTNEITFYIRSHKSRKLFRFWEFKYPNFSNACLLKADLRFQKLNGINLYAADLKEADLYESHLNHSDFSKSNLMGAELSRCSFKNAKIYKANMDYAKAIATNFSNSNLYKTSFKNASLRKSVFTGCDLRGCDFTDAIFQGAVLDGSNLTDSNISQYQLDSCSSCINIIR